MIKLVKIILVIAAFSVHTPSFSQTLQFNNPIAEQRADPWIYKAEDGTYYLIATVPEYDRIVLRKAGSINELNDAEEKVLWRKHESGVMGHHIWAPEVDLPYGIAPAVVKLWYDAITNGYFC